MSRRILDLPLDSEPVVGQWYRVPCARVRSVDGKSRWLPVMGRAHEDTDLAPYLTEHWHYDVRFLSDRCVQSVAGSWCTPPGPAVYALGIVMYLDAVRGLSVLPRRCYRRMPDQRDGLCHRLEPRYTDVVLATEAGRFSSGCRTCPHRGQPLGNLPVDEEGCVVCPGHGLKWSLVTGRLVSRVRARDERTGA